MSACQLFKHLRRKFTIVNTIRNFSYDSTSNTPPVKVLVPLKNRKLLKVSGKDAPNFLQGLITNDMRHFKENAKSIYAMFLNNKGRVLYDVLIYKWENEQSFLVECDESISNALQKHLKLFKLKQAVSIEDMFRTLYLWALISPANGIPSVQVDINSPISIYEDPRLTELGCRILTVPAMAAEDIINCFGKENQVKLGDEDIYKYLRYKLGVGEGAEELPPGLCYPLEANCDYLHGVSFHKGCYIGQELTARVYHTGVVRKRLMPIKFNREVTEHLEKDTLIKLPGNPKSNLGKLKGYIHNYGLGLVRIKEAVEAECLSIGDFSAQVVKPDWWPLEAPKEKPLEAAMEKHLEETKGPLVDAIEEKPVEIIKQSPLEDVNETLASQPYQKFTENVDETPVETNEKSMEDEAPIAVTNEKPMVDSDGAPIVETNERLTEDSNDKLILQERNKKPIEDTSEKPMVNKLKERLKSE